MKTKLKLLSISLSAVLLLGGCGYYVEVNEKSYVIAIGMDKGKNDLLKVSFMFSEPSAGDGETGGEKKKEKDIVTLEAPTVYSAIRLLDTFRSKMIDVSHTKLIVFSQELAEDGIKNYVTDLVNNRSFRPSVYLSVSQGEAEEFFSSIEPKQDLYIEKYIDRLFGKVTNNDVNEAYLYYTYFNYVDGRGGNLLPLVGVSDKDRMEDAEKDYEYVRPDDFSANYTADEIPIDKKDAAILCGYAVFDEEKMVGTLGLMDSDLVRMMTKNLPNGEFSVYYPEKGQYVSINMHQVDKTAISIKTGDIPEIDIEIKLMGEYSGFDKGFKNKAEYERFSDYLSAVFTEKLNELLRRSQTEFRTDMFNLGDSAKKRFLTNPQWDAYNWNARYLAADINARVIVDIDDLGELRYTPAGNER